jgi:hypothetical protein
MTEARSIAPQEAGTLVGVAFDANEQARGVVGIDAGWCHPGDPIPGFLILVLLLAASSSGWYADRASFCPEALFTGRT